MADKYLLQHNFEAAEDEVRKALEASPENIYARAYRERIQVLRREYEEKRRRQEESLQLMREKRIRELELEDEEEQGVRASPEALEQYRALLFKAWRDGALAPKEQAHLEQMREQLKISRNEHRRLQAEVKLNCYVDAVRAASSAEAPAPIRASTLEALRNKFGVTLEEHLAIEGRILWEFQQKARGGTIMIIDDEIDILNVLRSGLESEGYRVLTANSPEHALAELHNVVPDLILCDIRFPNSNLDGFSIYNKIRSRREFRVVPFVFVTGVKDTSVLQKGREVGADDFITKPFTMTMLLALIEGKLRRYNELKSSLT